MHIEKELVQQARAVLGELPQPEQPPRKGEYLIPAEATIVERDGQRYGLSHFADCPESRDWRKRGQK